MVNERFAALCGSFSVSDGGAIAFTGGTAQRPAEVQLARGGSARILTDLNRSLREVKSLGAVRKITAASSHDGGSVVSNAEFAGIVDAADDVVAAAALAAAPPTGTTGDFTSRFAAAAVTPNELIL